MKNELIKHLVATIKYRFKKSLKYGDKQFGEFSLGKGSRSINEILVHIIDVLNWATSQVLKNEKNIVANSEFEQLEEEFISRIDEFDKELSHNEIDLELSKRLVQGPLSDILTHIGQIAMLSRMNEKPIKKEDFSKANITEINKKN